MKAQYLTPVVTIFNQDGSVDVEGNKKVYEFLTDTEAYAGGVIPYFSLEAEEE